MAEFIKNCPFAQLLNTQLLGTVAPDPDLIGPLLLTIPTIYKNPDPTGSDSTEQAGIYKVVCSGDVFCFDLESGDRFTQ
jgi:hypothetical protein